MVCRGASNNVKVTKTVHVSEIVRLCEFQTLGKEATVLFISYSYAIPLVKNTSTMNTAAKPSTPLQLHGTI